MKNSTTTERIASKSLGLIILLFGIACLCAVPLYLLVYEESAPLGTKVAAIISGLLIGSAVIYSGAAVYRMDKPIR